APTVDAVVSDLRKIRYTVTNVRELREPIQQVKAALSRFERVSLYALAVFTRQLAVLLHAGIPLLRCIDGLKKQSLNPRLTRAVHEIHDDLKNGFSLSKAMARQPDVFNPIYISMIRAGEMSGAMDEMLNRLANLLEREFTLRKKVQAALTYPMLVSIACISLCIFLVNYVFPTFVDLFKGIDIDLPPETRALIVITKTLNDPTIMIPALLGIAMVLIGMVHYFRAPIGRRQWSWMMLELPVVGPVTKKVALTRFARTMGTLLVSGIPMMHALQITSHAVGNEVISDLLDEIQTEMSAGMSLSGQMANHKLFPPMLVHMSKVGEETGNLHTMLNKLADFYDTEVEYALETFTALVEPILISILGLVVAFVLIAVFKPIYALMQAF
ncbi:MAG: type II secretion system F family protein, partial [Candidatus Eremiobacterota bacterium]